MTVFSKLAEREFPIKCPATCSISPVLYLKHIKTVIRSCVLGIVLKITGRAPCTLKNGLHVKMCQWNHHKIKTCAWKIHAHIYYNTILLRTNTKHLCITTIGCKPNRACMNKFHCCSTQANKFFFQPNNCCDQENKPHFNTITSVGFSVTQDRMSGSEKQTEGSMPWALDCATRFLYYSMKTNSISLNIYRALNFHTTLHQNLLKCIITKNTSSGWDLESGIWIYLGWFSQWNIQDGSKNRLLEGQEPSLCYPQIFPKHSSRQPPHVVPLRA